MSVEAIVAAIEAAAASEAATTRDEAEREAAERTAQAEAAAQRRVDAAVREEEARLRAWESRTLNAARLGLIGRRMAATSAATGAAFATAAEHLAALADDPACAGRWTAALERFADEALEIVGPDGELRIRSADAARLRAARSPGGAPEAGDGADPPRRDPVVDVTLGPGLVARSADGRIDVDATIATRLSRAELLLVARVAALLEGPAP